MALSWASGAVARAGVELVLYVAASASRASFGSMSSGGASDLAAGLGAAVAERLSARGWHPVEQQLRLPGYIGEFSLPLADGFVALAELDRVGPYRVLRPELRLGVPEGAEVRQIDLSAPALEVTVSVGVGFEPALRLPNAIDASGIRDLLSEDVEDLEPPPSGPVVVVGSPAEVPQAAKTVRVRLRASGRAAPA